MLETGIQWILVEHGVVYQDMVDATSDFLKKGIFGPIMCQSGNFQFVNFGGVTSIKLLSIYPSIYLTTRCYISICSLENRLSVDDHPFGKQPTWYVRRGVKCQVPSNHMIIAHFQDNYQNDLINCLIHSYFHMILNLYTLGKFLKMVDV